MCQCRNNPDSPHWEQCCGEPYCLQCDWHLSECKCQSPLEAVQVEDGYQEQVNQPNTLLQVLGMIAIILVISGIISLALSLALIGIVCVMILIALTVFLLGKVGAIIFWVVALLAVSSYLGYRYVRSMPII